MLQTIVVWSAGILADETVLEYTSEYNPTPRRSKLRTARSDVIKTTSRPHQYIARDFVHDRTLHISYMEGHLLFYIL